MTEPVDEPIRLGERYELGGLLGRGGMADVRVGRDLRLGRTVAVKQLRSDLAADDTFQARFRKEAQSTAALNHPSIGAVYDTGESIDKHGNHVPYIVMEYIEGQTLRDIMRGAQDGRKILPERALSITADVLSAIDYSHRNGIIHRDIKPANVMLTPSGQVKVMDFGIARAIADTSSAMTQTAAVIGTAQYLSPEQARGETVDARSDIYSTGCLLYELLTGRPPFIGDSPVSVAYQHVREEARPPSQLNPDVSSTIDNIVAKSLAKKVEDRYQSAADMRKDIDRAVAGLHVDAPTAATVAAGAATQVAPAAPPLPRRDQRCRWRPSRPAARGRGRRQQRQVVGHRHRRCPPARRTGLRHLEDDRRAAADLRRSRSRRDRHAGRGGDSRADQRWLQGRPHTRAATRQQDQGRSRHRDRPARGRGAREGQHGQADRQLRSEQVTIPSFDGFSYDEAKKVLEGKGLKVKKSEQDSTLAKNQVINSNPPAGESVDFGSTVTLLVSKGQSTVPNVVGLTKEEAIAKLEDAGLKANVVEDPASTATQNTVASQDKPEGTVVAPGTTITIMVSTNPAMPPPGP